MAEHRYAQFCPTARAAEILGERWTLLIARELLCGEQRYSDLRRRLPGISSSVLTERLGRLEERGLVRRRELPPPAPATLYALTELGATLRPAMIELIRFGVRFTEAPRPGDHLEPDWMRLALPAFARTGSTPARRYVVRLPAPEGEVCLYVTGGRRGTRVRDGEGPADAELCCAPLTLLGLLSGGLDPAAALESRALEAEGDLAALDDFPALFDLASLLTRPPETPSAG